MQGVCSEEEERERERRGAARASREAGNKIFVAA